MQILRHKKEEGIPSTILRNKNGAGYITLISVLILSAVGVSIVVSLILNGLSSSRMSFATEQSAQARYMAIACAEEAMMQIYENTSFTGYGTTSIGDFNCGYDVTNNGGESRTINASSTVGTIVRKTKVTINAINPQITTTSWQEVSSF